MNGRIYDPTLGRFLQADPHIQAPENSQNYNRYSYVLNNPLSYTDPSGYFFKKIFKTVNKALGDFAPIVAIGLAFLGQTWAAQGIWQAATLGFVSGGVATGSLKGALVGGFSGAAFFEIGAHFTGALEGGFGHVMAHGITGGLSSVLQGGKFGHGFVSAGLTKALNVNKMIGTAAKDAGARIVTATVIGGTISKVTGGKFANGAVTSAFGQALNGEQQAEREQSFRDFHAKYGKILKAGDIDIDENMAEATSMTKEEFVAAVRTGGKWDYKHTKNYAHLVKAFGSDLMSEFGNVHFGIVAAANGFSLAESMAGAGHFQAWRQDGGSLSSSSLSGAFGLHSLPNSNARFITNQGFNWGDNLGDSLQIMQGHDYATLQRGCFGNSCW